ncbi:MAG: hypothetical protein KDJ52_17575 [Anaerolineae bacterium]|nr:hypothetical protein [Anaerolineae bacterium]
MMNEASLDLRIILKADEATLQVIREKLTSQDEEAQQLASKISSIALQALESAGLAGNINVDLQCGYISQTQPVQGGLDAQEWLSTDTPPEDMTEPHSAKKYEYENMSVPTGGLDAQEWMETETPPEDLDDRRPTESD